MRNAIERRITKVWLYWFHNDRQAWRTCTQGGVGGVDVATQELVKLSAPRPESKDPTKNEHMMRNNANTQMPKGTPRRKAATQWWNMVVAAVVALGVAMAAVVPVVWEGVGGEREECQPFVFSGAGIVLDLRPRWRERSGAPKWRDCDHPCERALVKEQVTRAAKPGPDAQALVYYVVQAGLPKHRMHREGRRVCSSPRMCVSTTPCPCGSACTVCT